MMDEAIKMVHMLVHAGVPAGNTVTSHAAHDSRMPPSSSESNIRHRERGQPPGPRRNCRLQHATSEAQQLLLCRRLVSGLVPSCIRSRNPHLRRRRSSCAWPLRTDQECSVAQRWHVSNEAQLLAGSVVEFRHQSTLVQCPLDGLGEVTDRHDLRLDLVPAWPCASDLARLSRHAMS